MENVKVLVVEDEVIIAFDICDALEELGYNVLEPAITYTEAIEKIEKEKPDIAILDIMLSGKKTGLDIAKEIRKKYHFPFIFLTSNSDSITLNQAKEVMPPAYLIKPFSKEELFTSIEIAISNFTKKENKTQNNNFKDGIFVKNKGSFLKVKFSDILYLKSSHVYVELFLIKDKKLIIRQSLSNFLESLNDDFVRVHRSFVVNINYIKEVNNDSLQIIDETIPLGKKYREGLISLIK